MPTYGSFLEIFMIVSRSSRWLALLTLVFFALSSASAAPNKKNAEETLFGTATIDSLLAVMTQFLPESVVIVKATVFPLSVTGISQTNALGSWVSEYIAYSLQSNPRFVLADQKQYRSTLRKLDISLKDVLDDSASLYIGRSMGVDYAILGSITGTGNENRCAIELRIINVKTGVILTGASSGSITNHYDQLASSMQTRRIKTEIAPTMVRSLVPGFAQLYRKRPIAGIITITTFLGSAAFMASQIPAYSKANKEFLDYQNFSLEKDQELYKVTGDSLKEIASAKLSPVIIGASMLGIAYLANVTDVLVASVIARKNFTLYFSCAYPLHPTLTLRYNF